MPLVAARLFAEDPVGRMQIDGPATKRYCIVLFFLFNYMFISFVLFEHSFKGSIFYV